MKGWNMAMTLDYEEALNPAQREAVFTLNGPLLVIAGAGSGKTRTLVYRVARLVEQGVDPQTILLLTFTRKASQEMLDRASSLADPRCRFVSGGTFHSLAHRILRRHASLLGFSQEFTILDRSDMEEVIHSLQGEQVSAEKPARIPKKGTLANILSKAANLERSIERILKEEYPQFLDASTFMIDLGERYGAYKKTHHLMDYDDLILKFRDLLAGQDAVRKRLSTEFQYVMVDEYQDTNGIQAEIVRWLAHEHRNVMVVGDDSQSIYSFRGANYRNMFAFPSLFPEIKVITLEQNYRSTQPVLNFANALMSKAAETYTKCLFTTQKGGQKPRVVDTRTEHDQALFVCRTLREERDKGRPFEDMAVLFRASYHSFELEAELTRQSMPYVKYGGFKFLESAHIKDFLAHLRVVENPEDAVSWVRILTLLDHVGEARSQAIFRWLHAEKAGVDRLGEWPGIRKGDSGLRTLGAMLKELTAFEQSPKKAVERALEHYAPVLKERFDDYPRRLKELEQLGIMAERYRSLRSLVDDLVLEPPNSATDLGDGNRHRGLTLSTVHSAKGLEWGLVFIIWASEGRFPAAMSYGNPEALEEERRLMYVASTRAKETLILCYPGEETQGGWGGQYGGNAFRSGLSSLVDAVPGDHVQRERAGGGGMETPWGPPMAQTPPIRFQGDGNGRLSQGDRVRHAAFGKGVVSRLAEGDKVEVLFRDYGKKIIHLKYGALEKIQG